MGSNMSLYENLESEYYKETAKRQAETIRKQAEIIRDFYEACSNALRDTAIYSPANIKLINQLQAALDNANGNEVTK